MNDDTISRRAAIDVCDNAIDLWHGQLGEGIVIAVKKKIEELLPAQPEIEERTEESAQNVPKEDLISRKAAIDRINKQREHLQPDIYPQDKIGDAAYRICAEFIERLPSAQPEIVTCEDCRWRKDQSGSTAWLPCRAIITPPDFYCCRAERRTDEGD